MFANVGWGEILVLVAAGLIILGPERLPGAIASTLSWVRKARDYVTGASAELREELGSDFDGLREPLQQLNELRSTNPRTLVTKHLLGGDDSLLDPKTYTDLPDKRSASSSPPQSAAEPRKPGRGRHDIADWDAT
ncbi:Sec-independent protein translocase protein TatB [Gordonia sp. (in: high G+C Gram-positive bacteria)]|uniref:Sec-independent protein translocase protein TatB n=1 Tax=Gordonia sp. (in: high G+C Gram-positive bacteria) TaxID=84139 RepID=UPI0039E6D1B8